jgi:hypothetical protein
MARVLVMRCVPVVLSTDSMILPINALRLQVAVVIMGQGTNSQAGHLPQKSEA